ncbi:MAG TPA: ATP synthase F1 subunit delta [Candidatus Limnocylindrales bacterium]|nr:ATP synthase F1 subunit delta [Candidatus Limnocylindrales bacterium]
MSALAQRYAAALADAAFARNEAGSIRRDLGEFAAMLENSSELRNVLTTPAIGPDAKKRVLAELVEKMGLRAEVRNFLFVLVDHGRTGILGEIRQAFEAEINVRMGIVDANVISARELSAEEKSQLARTLEHVTGKKVQSQYQLDASLIGGTTVRIGSTIYDGSVREQLDRLRTQLEAQ